MIWQGEDYEITTPSMRAVAWRGAKESGKQLRTRAMKEGEKEGLAIQAYE